MELKKTYDSIKYNSIKIFTKVYSLIKNPENNICFYEPTYTGNAKSIYEYIIENKLNEKYKLNLIWIYTKYINIKIPYKGFTLNTIKGFFKYLKCKILLSSNTLYKKEKGVIKNKKSYFLLSFIMAWTSLKEKSPKHRTSWLQRI